MREEGTKAYPWIISVDVHHPERNREFCVTPVQKMKRDGWSRSGWHIRRSIPLEDHLLWEMTVPGPERNEYNSFEERCVLIKGPSRDAWIRDSDYYHTQISDNATNKKKFDQATMDAHKEAENMIEGDDERKFCYWLLIWPTSYYLDNTIFSKDTHSVHLNRVGLQVSKKKSQINETCHGLAIFWEISDKYGGMRLEKKEAPPSLDGYFEQLVFKSSYITKDCRCPGKVVIKIIV